MGPSSADHGDQFTTASSRPLTQLGEPVTGADNAAQVLSSRPSRSTLVAAAVVVLLLQIAVYWQSFQMKPSGDDFGPPLTEIERGERDGPGAFFSMTPQANRYRPAQSLLMWMFGRWDDVPIGLSTRALSFTCMAAFLGALAAWLHVLRVGKWGTIAAMLALALHPLLAAPIASIDGFSTLATAATVWWGAWFIRGIADRPTRAAILAVLFIVPGLLVKEYALALLPLGVLTAWVFAPRHVRWKSSLLVAVALVLTVGGYFILRSQIPVDDPAPSINPVSVGTWKWSGVEVLDSYREGNDPTIHPLVLGLNVATLLAGISFYGNTAQVFVERTALEFALVAVGCATLCLLVLVGVIKHRRNLMRSRQESDSPASNWISLPRLVTFLLLAVFASTFPANMMGHISEMRISAALLPLAVLIGISFSGWRSIKPLVMASVTMAALFAWGATSIQAKVNGLRGAGERAEMQLRQIKAIVEQRPEVTTIALLFPPANPPKRSYSVFYLDDGGLISHASYYGWFKPVHVRWKSFATASPSSISDIDQFDLVLVWDRVLQKFLVAEIPTGTSARQE